MSANTCPRCGLTALVGGQLNPSETMYTGSLFVPNHLNARRSAQGLPLTRAEVSSCVKCGLVWSELDPADLRDLIQTSGKPIAVQQLDRFLHGRDRDLPQTDLAQEVGAKVAEVDDLVMAGKTGEVTRRYRELSGVTWDQAIKDTRHWHDLERDDKLALFGWAPKQKASMDDLSETIME